MDTPKRSIELLLSRKDNQNHHQRQRQIIRPNLTKSMFIESDLDPPDVMFQSLDENRLELLRCSNSSHTLTADEDEDSEYTIWEQELLDRLGSSQKEKIHPLEHSDDWCDKCEQYLCNGDKCFATATSEQLEELLTKLEKGEDVVVPVLTISMIQRQAESSELLHYSADVSQSIMSTEDEVDKVECIRGFPCLMRKNVIFSNWFQDVHFDAASPSSSEPDAPASDSLSKK